MWQDENKRKGLLATALVHAVLILLFIFFGFNYLEPKPEEGIAISLGVIADGSPSEQPSQKVQETVPEPVEAEEPVEEPVEDVVEEMATQDVVEAPVIEQEKEEEKKPVEEKPKEPSPDAEAAKALDFLEKNKNNSPNGDKQGDNIQGKPEGQDFTPNFNGPDGLGNLGEGYYLDGRNALSTPKPQYPCSASGKVIVKVWVSKSGDVRRAEGGFKGSTSTDPCLVREAEKAARQTKWQSDFNASESQIGYIVYIFKKQ